MIRTRIEKETNPGIAPCPSCGGERRIGAAHLTLQDHLVIVFTAGIGGAASLLWLNVEPALAASFGIGIAAMILVTALHQRFAHRERRCRGCGRRELVPIPWAYPEQEKRFQIVKWVLGAIALIVYMLLSKGM